MGMSEENIKKIVKRYKLLSWLCLSAFLIFAIAVDWFLKYSDVNRRIEHGLENYSGDTGFIWGTVIFGFFLLLHLCFYSLQKILLSLHKENLSSN